MRLLVTLSVALLPAVSAVAADFPKYVDLDRPGAFEALRESNPGHFEEAARRVEVASKVCDFKSTTREVRAEIPVRCGYMYMTSFPPKRRITFLLEDTQYGATVAVENFGGEMKPAVLPGN